MPLYIFVTGGVMSGIGKGVVSASIGKILQTHGLRVNSCKIDPYLNLDAGTMNPYRHGEVFVTDDGGEIDVDFGHYERMLGIKMKKNQNITSGQVYSTVIENERRGDYLGVDVQIIPHLTDEIKRRILSIDDADVVMVEVGGTVGDIESEPFLEAIRQLRSDLPKSLLVHVGYIAMIGPMDEPKTKPTQHSVRELRSAGLMPDIIVCRSKKPVPVSALNKVALFANVKPERVFGLHTLKTIYQAPIVLDEQGMGDKIVETLGLPKKKADWTEWKKVVDKFLNPGGSVKIAMTGKYAELDDSYISVREALKHAAAHNGVALQLDTVPSEDFEDKSKLEVLKQYDGIVVPGGFGPRGVEGKINVVQFARENNIPFLGLCYGLQMAVIEFARNVCGLKGANTTEVDPKTKHPVIFILPTQRGVKKKGGTMRLGATKTKIAKGTCAYTIYGCGEIERRHRHRYEVNPKYIKLLESKGLVFAGKSPEGIVDTVEIPRHKFFFGTQYHPEFSSNPAKPEEAFFHFIKAAVSK